jgi:hypothetical protein
VCALLFLYRSGVGLAPTLLFLARLGGFWRLCGCFYGWDALHQSSDDAPCFGVGLALDQDECSHACNDEEHALYLCRKCAERS